MVFMGKFSKQFFIILLIMLLGLAVGMSLYRLTHAQTPPLSEKDLKNATLLKQPRSLPSFSLVDMYGKSFTNEALKGQWSLIFFGFTHCPSICPTALASLNKIYKRLNESGMKKLPRVIFVSVDPEQDSTAVLQKYLSHFNSNFLGVTGNEAQINLLAKSLGAVYMTVEGPNQESTIDHSAGIFVINPNGDFYALFSSTEKTDEIIADLKKMIR